MNAASMHRAGVFILSAVSMVAALSAQDAAPDSAAVHVLEKALAPALAAYEARDAKALHACFAKTAPGIKDTATVERVFFGYYRKEFGRLREKRLSLPHSTVDLERGMLVYAALFENGLVQMTAHFQRENGELKLAQLRFEKMER